MSPDRYRAAGYGVDVTAIEDTELRAILARATALAESYCAVPHLPQKHSFAGGTITAEQHSWRLANEVTYGDRRVYLWHRPVKAVTSFAIRLTPQYSVSVGPGDIFINNSEGYIELVSLAAVSFGIYPVGVVPNLGLLIPVVETSYTYGYEFASVDEPLDITDGRTFRAQYAYWLSDPAPVIEKNGTTVPDTDYTVNYQDGSIRFNALTAATDSITASYSYSLPSQILDAIGSIATSMLGERAIASKGLTGLDNIKIAEVSISRVRPGMFGNRGSQSQSVIPEDAKEMLAPFVFRSVGLL